MSSRRKIQGGRSKAEEFCSKEVDKRDRARALFKPLKAAHDAHKKDPYIPDSSIWKRSKASLKYWNAKRKLTNCLSRYDRRAQLTRCNILPALMNKYYIAFVRLYVSILVREVDCLTIKEIHRSKALLPGTKWTFKKRLG